MKETFAVIGNNWGNKIFNILLALNFKVIKVNLKSPKRYKNDKAYLYHLNKQLNLIRKECSIIWLAITPNKNKQFQIVKKCLNKKFHLTTRYCYLSCGPFNIIITIPVTTVGSCGTKVYNYC